MRTLHLPYPLTHSLTHSLKHIPVLNALINMSFPGCVGGNWYRDRSTLMTRTPFGDGVDVLTDDAPSWLTPTLRPARGHEQPAADPPGDRNSTRCRHGLWLGCIDFSHRARHS